MMSILISQESFVLFISIQMHSFSNHSDLYNASADHSYFQKRQKLPSQQKPVFQTTLLKQSTYHNQLTVLQAGHSSLFSVRRGGCLLCSQKCVLYLSKPSLKKGLLSCRNCQCPMTAHKLLKNSSAPSRKLWNQLSKVTLSQSHLNFNGKVVIIGLQEKSEYNRNYQRLVQSMGQFGQSCLEQQSMSAREVIGRLCISEILVQKDVERKLNLDERLGNLKKMLKRMETSQGFEIADQADRISLSLIKLVQERVGGQLSYRVLLIKEERSSRPLLQSFMEKRRFQGLSLVHQSSDRLRGLADCQTFFEEHFKVSYSRIFMQKTSRKDQFQLKDYLYFNKYIPLDSEPKGSPFSAAANTCQQLVAKLGPVLPISLKSSKVIEMQQQFEGKGQRVVLILKPLLAKSCYDQLIINVFRLNNFTIVSRKLAVLSQAQVRFAAEVEGLDVDQLYRSILGPGFCQVVVMSKLNALLQAKLILQGQALGPIGFACNFVDNLSVEFEQNGRTYSEYLDRHYYNVFLKTQQYRVFEGVARLVDLSKALIGERAFPTFVKDLSTQNILQISKTSKELSVRKKQFLLEDFRASSFNYLAFVTSDSLQTDVFAASVEEDAALFQHSLLLVKPGCLPAAEQIKRVLQKIGFTISHARLMSVNKQLASQLVQNRDSQLQAYYANRSQIMMVVKPGGQLQLNSLLAQSDLSIMAQVKFLQKDLQSKQLHRFLVLANNQHLEDVFLKMLSPQLDDLRAKLLGIETYSQEIISRVNQHICFSILGVPLKSCSLSVCHTAIGKFYVRHNSPNALLRIAYAGLIRRKYVQRVPLVNQYRHWRDVTLQFTSYAGQPFIQQILKMKNQLQIKDGHSQLKRGYKSLVVLIWAKKLGLWVEQILELGKSCRGFGAVTLKEGQLVGSNFSKKEIIELQRKRYQGMLQQLFKTFSHQELTITKSTISRLIHTQSFERLYESKNLRLQPQRLSLDSLRIDSDLVLLNNQMKQRFTEFQIKRQFLNKEEEVFNSDYCLVNTKPAILPYQTLLARIWVILQIQKEQGSSKAISSLQNQFMSNLKAQVMLSVESALQVNCYLALFQQLFLATNRLKNAKGSKGNLQSRRDLLRRICEEGQPKLKIGSKPLRHQEKSFKTQLLRIQEDKKQKKGAQEIIVNLNENVQVAEYIDPNDRLQVEWHRIPHNVKLKNLQNAIQEKHLGGIILRMKEEKQHVTAPSVIPSQQEQRSERKTQVKLGNQGRQFVEKQDPSTRAIDREIQKFRMFMQIKKEEL